MKEKNRENKCISYIFFKLRLNDSFAIVLAQTTNKSNANSSVYVVIKICSVYVVYVVYM